jgi:hypothetical protein
MFISQEHGKNTKRKNTARTPTRTRTAINHQSITRTPPKGKKNTDKKNTKKNTDSHDLLQWN